MSTPKKNYNITTKAGERVYTRPGTRGPNDMQIFTVFPKQPWKTTLAYMGVVLRLKGMVEDGNYPPANGYDGAWKLLKFIRDCIMKRSVSIWELCSQYEMPNYVEAEGKCACGLPAEPNDKWCRYCREALNNWEKL